MLLASLVLGVLFGSVGTDWRVFLSILPMSILLVIVGIGTDAFASVFGGAAWFVAHISVFEVALVAASLTASLLRQRKPFRPFSQGASPFRS